MENEFAYIDNKPFKICNTDKQILSIMNLTDTGIEFKIQDFKKYYIWDKENFIPEIYGVDSKLRPITAFRIFINKSDFSAIPSTTITSDLYFYSENTQIGDANQIQHFTRKTKISKIIYYHDEIKSIFGNESFYLHSKYKKGKLKTIEIKGKDIKDTVIGKINIGETEIECLLSSKFVCNQSFMDTEKITVQDKSSIVLKFKKGITIDEAYKIMTLLDSTLHLIILTKKRHRKIEIMDFNSNKYLCKDKNTYNIENKNKEKLNLICKKDDIFNSFVEIFKTLYYLEKNSKNSLFPFIEYDRKGISLEISFLEYYRVLEYLNLVKQKSKGKGKNPNFMKDILKNNKELVKLILKQDYSDEIEEEIRALRNYYSHEGYYIDKLPIPTEKPVRYKEINNQWLNNIYKIIKTLSYLEIYKLCGFNISYDEIIYYI